MAERLGPVLDDLMPSDEWPKEAIELDQWFAYLDEPSVAEQLPKDFAQDFRDLIREQDWTLDEELISVVDMDAPDGDTGEAAA